METADAAAIDHLLQALHTDSSLLSVSSFELADRYQVPPAAAAEALSAAKKRHRQSRPPKPKKRLFLDMGSAWNRFLVSLTERPLAKLLLYFGIQAADLIVITGLSLIPFGIPLFELIRAILILWLVIVILVTLALQYLVLIMNGQSRYAWILAGLLTIPISVAMEVSMLASDTKHVQAAGTGGSSVLGRAAVLVILLAVGIMIGVFIGIANTFVTVLAGYVKARQDEKADRHQSRRESLSELMALQARLPHAQTVSRKPTLKPVSFYYRHWPWSAIGILGTVEIIRAVVGGLLIRSLAMSEASNSGPPAHYVAMTIIGSTIGLVSIGILVLIGLGSRSQKEVLLNYSVVVLAYSAADTLAHAFIIKSFGFSPYGINILSTAFNAAFILEAAFIGAELQRRSIFNKRLELNDRDALVTQIARIKIRLGQSTRAVTVMAIDAAKSAQMKAGEDPAQVELAFRSYQEWISSICAKEGGKVHATAGDGAILAFDRADQAFLSAKRIQTDLARFNAEENPLKTPFSLRIGLHTGSVMGDIDSVVFTDVIDIAAHVEGVSTVGGIALTEPCRAETAAQYPHERFAELPEMTDRERVHIALSPLLEPEEVS